MVHPARIVPAHRARAEAPTAKKPRKPRAPKPPVAVAVPEAKAAPRVAILDRVKGKKA